MHIRNINTIFMLIAGIIAGVYSLFNGYEIQKTAYILLTVLIVFYVIGTILQTVVNQILQKVEDREQEEMKAVLDEKARTLEETPETMTEKSDIE